MSAEEKESKRQARLIDNEIREAQREDDDIIKLLLLGAGESGKSTIFKQMRKLYGDGFSEQDRHDMAPIILANLIDGTKTVLSKAEEVGFPLKNEAALKAQETLLAAHGDGGTYSQGQYDEHIAGAIAALWADDDFQGAYGERAKYQLFDCYNDFAKKAKDYPEWGGEGWCPGVNDVMRARVRTSGIVEEKYEIDRVNFRMYDVGGQRNERKKWIHCFQQVTAVIFVGAISEYDQVLYEDKNQNRLIEAVELFDEICNSKWFQETSMILFLNKKDLFEIKYLEKQVPLNCTGLFPTAPNVIDKEVAFEWLVGLFTEKNESPEKEIYHHITCATDSKNVETVFNACKDIILKHSLSNSGFA